MTATETQIHSPEQFTQPFNGFKYCVDVYEAARDLPPIFQTREGEELRTKALHRKGGHERPVDITKFINKLTEEADLMVSGGLEQFMREHPGMGDSQRDEFGDIVRDFTILSGLLSKKDGSNVVKMSDLPAKRFAEAITSLSDMYLQYNTSYERREAGLAQRQYDQYMTNPENVPDQPVPTDTDDIFRAA